MFWKYACFRPVWMAIFSLLSLSMIARHSSSFSLRLSISLCELSRMILTWLLQSFCFASHIFCYLICCHLFIKTFHYFFLNEWLMASSFSYYSFCRLSLRYFTNIFIAVKHSPVVFHNLVLRLKVYR